MIGYFLSNTNESTTVLILQKNFGTKQGLTFDFQFSAFSKYVETDKFRHSVLTDFWFGLLGF